MSIREPIPAVDTDDVETINRKKPINTTLDPAAAEVFIQYVNDKHTNPSLLLSEIVWAWANHPARSRTVLSLPPETSVLYQNESLNQYLTRVSISVIEAAIEDKQGNFAAVARTLQCDRSALHKRLVRLKASTATDFDHSLLFQRARVLNEPDTTDQAFAPLSVIKRKYINVVLEHCNGNKGKAAEILGIPITQLDLEISDHSLRESPKPRLLRSPWRVRKSQQHLNQANSPQTSQL